MPLFRDFTDEQLIEEVRSNNKELYVHIVERYQNKLMRYITYLIHDEQKAADIVQETFIKAYVNLNGFNINKKFSSWIYRIAHNETMNMFSRYKNQTSLDQKRDFDSGIVLEDELVKKELKAHTEYCLNQ